MKRTKSRVKSKSRRNRTRRNRRRMMGGGISEKVDDKQNKVLTVDDKVLVFTKVGDYYKLVFDTNFDKCMNAAVPPSRVLNEGYKLGQQIKNQMGGIKPTRGLVSNAFQPDERLYTSDQVDVIIGAITTLYNQPPPF